MWDMMRIPSLSAVLAAMITFLIVRLAFDAKELKQMYGLQLSITLCVLLYLLVFECTMIVSSMIEIIIWYM